MQRFLTFFSLLIVAGMAAQAQNVRSLGHIPPYFNLPAEGEQVRFTSLEQPEFAVPEYPKQLQHEGKEGVVEVTCYVTSEGDVVYSEISVSSGNDAFDKQALKSALETSLRLLSVHQGQLPGHALEPWPVCRHPRLARREVSRAVPAFSAARPG